MNVKLVNRGTAGEFFWEGRLDTNAAPEVQKLMVEAVERFDSIIINLKGLQYISSSGLRVLKILFINLNKRGAQLTVTNVPKSVMEVFEMTGFAQILPIE